MVSGFYDEHGNACLKFFLYGVRHSPPGVEYSGIIDTGFTGFIQLPLQHAMSLMLPLEGTTTHTLADGSKVPNLTARAVATITRAGGKTEAKPGTVVLSPRSQSVLIGMGFLQQFGLGLYVGSAVALFDNPSPTPAAKS
jgi:predicted aspartyl protease